MKMIYGSPDRQVTVRYRTPPTYLQPAVLGKEVMEGIEMVRTDLEKTSDQFDLNSGGSESQVRSPAGIKTFSAAADKNVERKRKKVARFIKELIIFQFKQVATFWKPEDGKTIAVLDNNQNSGMQVNAEVLQVIGGVGQLYNLDIEVESMSVNKSQQKQDALDLFTLAVQHPDVFQIPVFAKNLLENGYGYKDADRYLLTEEQRAQMASGQKPQLGENVSIRVDAATPVGAQLLEEAGLLPQGSAQALSAASQVQNSPLPPELAPPPNGQTNGQMLPS
jgi:galactitol-specific phosphotransferase system IIB component